MIYSRIIRCLVVSVLLVGCAATAQAQNLSHSTYFGGTRGDGGYAFPIVVSPGGDVYIALRTDSSDVPLAGTPVQDSFAGRGDLVIARFNSDLSELKASTYLGGTSEEGAWPSIDMALDEDALVIAFPSSSMNLPASADAYQASRKGDSDIGIVRLSLDLSTIQACTYLGGSDMEGFVSVALTPEGDVVVAGSTLSRNFPRTDAYPAGLSGGRTHGDIFVCVLDPELTTLKSSRLLPGNSDDVAEALCIQSDGTILLGGWTRSTNLASYEGSPDYHGGPYDGFVVQLEPDLTISKMAYVGGSDWDFVYAMAVTPDQIAISGHTASLDFPTSSGVIGKSYLGDGAANVGDDAFVTVLDRSLNIVSSTYLGGEGWENATALVSVPSGWVVAGQTNSAEFSGASFDPQGDNPYATEGFLALLNARLSSATVLQVGGEGIDCPAALANSPDRNVFLLMGTTSTDLPITDGAWQAENAGGTLRMETMIWSGDVWIGRFQL